MRRKFVTLLPSKFHAPCHWNTNIEIILSPAHYRTIEERLREIEARRKEEAAAVGVSDAALAGASPSSAAAAAAAAAAMAAENLRAG